MTSGLPDVEQAKAFQTRVDNVAMLVEGLSKGTLTPDYIDAKLAREGDKVAKQLKSAVVASTVCESASQVRRRGDTL
jgi:hypothetical protein